LTPQAKSIKLALKLVELTGNKYIVRRGPLKRLSLCFALALLAILLCVLPAVASTYREPGGVILPSPYIEDVTVTTLPATDITHDSATLNASVTLPISGKNSNLIYVDYITIRGHFQYGTKSGVYASITPDVTKEYTDTLTFRATVTGLRPCTKYYARFVLYGPATVDYEKTYSDYLISFLSSGTAGIHGLGVGLSYNPNIKDISNVPQRYYYGNEIIFTTTGCQVSTGPLGQGGSVGSGAPSVTTTSPIQMSNIVVQSAAIAATTVAPGEKVDVTASISNKGSANGDAKVTLYVNGQEMESQGVTVASGQTSPVHFSLSMNEPGTYTVSVGNVPAGSFTVDAFANNDFLIYGLIALFTIGLAVAIYTVTRKRTA
jgi:hypothetical protein